MRYTPQELDRLENEWLDNNDRFHTVGALCGRPQLRSHQTLPAHKRTGREWGRIGVRRHGRMPTLNDMERRQR